MQQRRGDRRRIHAELGDEHRDGRGVRDVGLTGDALLPFVRLRGVGVGAAHQLRVALGVMAEYFLRERVGVDVSVTLRPQPIGDADDPRCDRRGALRHYANTGIAPPARRSISDAVPTGPKSRSSSSTKPRRPVPMLTTASTRPASVIPSA